MRDAEHRALVDVRLTIAGALDSLTPAKLNVPDRTPADALQRSAALLIIALEQIKLLSELFELNSSTL